MSIDEVLVFGSMKLLIRLKILKLPDSIGEVESAWHTSDGAIADIGSHTACFRHERQRASRMDSFDM